MDKQRAVKLSDDSWELAKSSAKKLRPQLTRPAWIENAIYAQAIREHKKRKSNKPPSPLAARNAATAHSASADRRESKTGGERIPYTPF